MNKVSDLKVVALGGGTGLSTMLRGIKEYTENISAIVTVADDGGSSGRLREDLNIPAPGDIRNCVVALADAESILKRLFRYRFPCGKLKGHSFGNLFLAAMTEVTGDFESAIEHMSSVLAVKGCVLPVTKDNVDIKAHLCDGSVVFGESNIPRECLCRHSSVDYIETEPKHIKAFDKCIEAINNADVILYGPGSLYTSIIPNLLADGICTAIQKSHAKKIYICNVMTQPGETDGYTAFDHAKAIISHAGADIIDICIANNGSVCSEIAERYRKQGAGLIELDSDKFKNAGIELIDDNLIYIDENEKVRHDYMRLAEIITQISMQ